MSYRPHGRASVTPSSLSSFLICDRCGTLINDSAAEWSRDYRGMQIQNTRMRVCRQCQDVPQAQLRPILIGVDPLPLMNPRPEPYAQDDEGNVTPAEGAVPPPYVPDLD